MKFVIDSPPLPEKDGGDAEQRRFCNGDKLSSCAASTVGGGLPTRTAPAADRDGAGCAGLRGSGRLPKVRKFETDSDGSMRILPGVDTARSRQQNLLQNSNAPIVQARSTIPGVQRAPIEVTFRGESAVEVEKHQILPPEATSRKH